MPRLVKQSEWQLTEETRSVCIDLGIYWASYYES